ncbi:hypothetical protein [Halomonas sp. KO116]|uniref:hypothetical protein n=1 Tax=Halomonas sp. KO116 TaxID=1504981 RepID=UPI0004E3C4E0|nr:hypothetical protein [Halomonas sp. KO116]AJY49158.1 hypothetical protein KO116_00659 [Halomonas sp. KO116]
MSEDFKTNAEKYLYSRDQFRKLAQHKFLEFNEHSNLLIASTNELIASITLFCSGRSFREIDNGLYCADLMVSFCRSHFIASDLVLGGDLVDGAVIIRKQMELLARLNELKSGADIERLIRKTPNIKHLKSGLKRLYSEYSEVAHSASPKVMELLGRRDYESGVYTLVYPDFQENAYVSLQHLILSAFEYYVWAANFLSDNFEDYDAAYHSKLFEKSFETHNRIYTGKPISELGT